VLATSLLLVVEVWHLTLIFLGQLFEQLESRRKVLDEGVFDFVGLRVLSDLKQRLVQVADRT